MGGTSFVPMLSLDAGLTHYLTEIRKFPMLRQDEESAYAKRWREQNLWLPCILNLKFVLYLFSMGSTRKEVSHGQPY
ncbi:sigma-70 factor domain-containing protein [Bradyrhizobium sp. OAE829]|uniref:sigma-70 factor domain-containing protein n=1 Tax=Bradyrhizobium sp. OAE829 TaxID=2663807 RepID=UPI0019E8308F